MGAWRTRAVAGLVVTMLAAAVACTSPPSNTGGGGLGTGEGEATTPAGDDAVRLNELQFIGTHNSYKSAPDARDPELARPSVPRRCPRSPARSGTRPS